MEEDRAAVTMIQYFVLRLDPSLYLLPPRILCSGLVKRMIVHSGHPLLIIPSAYFHPEVNRQEFAQGACSDIAYVVSN